MVIRAWTEGDPVQLRVRITYSLDVLTPRQRDVVLTSADVDDVTAKVREWLLAVIGS